MVPGSGLLCCAYCGVMCCARFCVVFCSAVVLCCVVLFRFVSWLRLVSSPGAAARAGPRSRFGWTSATPRTTSPSSVYSTSRPPSSTSLSCSESPRAALRGARGKPRCGTRTISGRARIYVSDTHERLFISLLLVARFETCSSYVSRLGFVLFLPERYSSTPELLEPVLCPGNYNAKFLCEKAQPLSHPLRVGHQISRPPIKQ